MPRKIGVKRLTASDLTFFEWHFRHRNAGNQKAINLNADVFISDLYPALPELSIESGGKIPIDLSVFGPGTKGLHNLQRKIVKFGAYKNWRLNGEFIYNPSEDSERYNSLRPGDFAVMEFLGVGVPNAIALLLVASSVTADTRLHAEIDAFMKGRKMAPMTSTELEAVVGAAKPDDRHPVRTLAVDRDLEDAALGGSTGRRHLHAHSATRQITKDALLHARKIADETGRLGEELVNGYLNREKAAGRLGAVEWTSQVDAVAPYDFRVVKPGGQSLLIDVKSTSGEFDRPVHFSFNEILQIVNGEEPYEVFRVYQASAAGGRLRICHDVRTLCQNVLEAITAVPDGVTVDGVSVTTAKLTFSDESALEPSDEDESQA